MFLYWSGLRLPNITSEKVSELPGSWRILREVEKLKLTFHGMDLTVQERFALCILVVEDTIYASCRPYTSVDKLTRTPGIQASQVRVSNQIHTPQAPLPVSTPDQASQHTPPEPRAELSFPREANQEPGPSGEHLKRAHARTGRSRVETRKILGFGRAA